MTRRLQAASQASAMSAVTSARICSLVFNAECQFFGEGAGYSVMLPNCCSNNPAA
jgi:hypothetical protein